MSKGRTICRDCVDRLLKVTIWRERIAETRSSWDDKGARDGIAEAGARADGACACGPGTKDGARNVRSVAGEWELSVWSERGDGKKENEEKGRGMGQCGEHG